MNIPNILFYTKNHEWVKIKDNTATIGITDYAQDELGDIIFIEFPNEGLKCKSGDPVATIEAVKTVADIYTPLSGTVVEINKALDDDPSAINKDPYKGGWIFKLHDLSEDHSHLISASEYNDLIK